MIPNINLFQKEITPIVDESGRQRFRIMTNGERFAIQRLWSNGWKWIETGMVHGYRVVKFDSKKQVLTYLKDEWGSHFVVEPNEWRPL